MIKKLGGPAGVVAALFGFLGGGQGRSEAAATRSGQTGSNPFVCAGMDARDVLTVIQGQGAELRNSREAVFYFYGDKGRLPKLQEALEALGFAVKPTRTDPGLIATISTVVDEGWLGEMMPKLCSLASASGVTYDGWEASIPEVMRR